MFRNDVYRSFVTKSGAVLLAAGLAAGSLSGCSGQNAKPSLAGTEQAGESGTDSGKNDDEEASEEASEETTKGAKKAEESEKAYQKLFTEALEGKGVEENQDNLYRTVKVVKGDFSQNYIFKASVLMPEFNNVSIDNSNVLEEGVGSGSYTIEETFVEQWQIVKAGDPLFSFSLMKDVDEIALAEAELNLKRSKENYDEFYASNSKSQKEWILEITKMAEGTDKQLQMHQYTIAQLQFERNVASMQERIAEEEKQLENMRNNKVYTVTAPNDGLVQPFNAKKSGDSINGTDVYLSINSYANVLLQIEDKEGRLRSGQTVTISTKGENDKLTVGGPNTTTGVVVSAPASVSADFAGNYGPYAYIKPAEVSAFINVEPMNMNNFWGNGPQSYSVLAEVVSEQNVLTLDKRAVQNDTGKFYVYVVENGLIHKRYFTQGGNNGDIVWILDGLDEGTGVALLN